MSTTTPDAAVRPAAPTLPRATPGAPVDPSLLTSGSVGASVPGVPTAGPDSGPIDPTSSGGSAPAPAPGGGTSPTPTPGSGSSGGVSSPTPGTGTSTGGPSPAPGGTSSGTDGDGFATAAGASMLDLLKNAVSPEAVEAQNILLRRFALQGDVIPSRVPAPRNITEIGGYLNLLTTLNEFDMRSQVLAGILGVAGPSPQLGWVTTPTPLTFSALVNDRPAGAIQATLPVTVPVRSDFAGPLRAAMQALHDRGCMLPLVAGPLALPPPDALTTAPPDPLDYVGRVLRIAAAAALTDPTTDTVVLIRAPGSTDPFQIAVRSTETGTIVVPAADFDALASITGTTVSLAGAKLAMLAPIIAAAGFSPAVPLPQPTAAAPSAWTRLVNTSGLVAGSTKLGDELRLLHSQTEIAASAFAGMRDWLWNGSAFAG